MEHKKIRKSIPRFAGWIGLQACSLIIRSLPRQWLYGFARIIAAIGYRVAAKQRRIALDSLRIAFGREKTESQREKIAKECFEFMAKAAVELIFLMERPLLLAQRISFKGREHLDAALARGRGVILVSAHFGNFPLLLGRLSLAGYKAGGIMRPMRDSRVEKIFLKRRKELGVKTIYSQPRKVCVETTIKALRDNEIVFIPIDQNFGTGGVFVRFFGKQAATATGPAVLAMRTGAAIIPCFIVRQPDDTHRIIFEPELRLKEGGLKEAAGTQETIQRLTDIIEAYIRKYPAEWGWIHRRWKSAPREGPAA